MRRGAGAVPLAVPGSTAWEAVRPLSTRLHTARLLRCLCLDRCGGLLLTVGVAGAAARSMARGGAVLSAEKVLFHA